MKNQEIKKNVFKDKKESKFTNNKLFNFFRLKYSESLKEKTIEVLDGSILTKESFLQQAPFIGLIVALAFIYISISYYSLKTIIKIEKSKEEIKELRFEYLTVKSDLIQFIQLSNLELLLEKQGVKIANTPPDIIKINKEKNKK